MIDLQNSSIAIKLSYLEALEQTKKDFKRATSLIKRLRAENKVLKIEKQNNFKILEKTKEDLKHQPQRRYGVILTKVRHLKTIQL
jgi:hypothetical protein